MPLNIDIDKWYDKSYSDDKFNTTYSLKWKIGSITTTNQFVKAHPVIRLVDANFYGWSKYGNSNFNTQPYQRIG